MGAACSSTDASGARSVRIRWRTARHASSVAGRGGAAGSGVFVAGATAPRAPPAATRDSVDPGRGCKVAIEVGADDAVAIAKGPADAVGPAGGDVGPDVTPEGGVDGGGARRV